MSKLNECPRWYACYTYGRHEKRVAQDLERSGIESYLPLRLEERQWSDRVSKVELPYFPSYVFGRFGLDQLSRVLSIAGVVSVVRMGTRPIPIPDLEIEHIRRVADVARRYGFEPEVSGWVEAGVPVRVVDGAFKGVEGVVLQRRGQTYVMVGLGPLQRGLTVQIAQSDLEPIG